MPTEPAQIAIVAFEIGLFLSGIALLLWLLINPAPRSRWLGTNALPPAAFAWPDLLLCGALVFMTGFAFQAAAQIGLGPVIAKASDREGLTLVVYSVANYLGALVGWRFLFPSLRRSWLIEPTIPAPVTPPPRPPLASSQVVRYGAATLMLALPLLSAVNVGWLYVVEKLGLPAEVQDVVAIFANTRSPFIIAGMLLVACVLAPVYEELLFRAGIYRFCRQRLGRGWALVISGVSFGALHGYWAGFLPLAALGMGLALAYEATGDIRVPIIAHALFNLNTVLMLLSGLAPGVS